MIPHRRRWERHDDSQTSIPNSRFRNSTAGRLVQCTALGPRNLTWQISNPIASVPETPAGPVQIFAKSRSRGVSPLVVAIDSEQEAEPLAKKLHRIDATQNWVHVQVPGNCIWRTGELMNLWEIVARTAAARVAGKNQVYLFGTGPGAEIALRWLALQPSKFCGVGIFDGSCPNLQDLFTPAIQLTHRAFLAASTGNSSIRRMLDLGRLLHSTGMNVTTSLCAARPNDDELPATKILDFVKWTQRLIP